MGKPVAGRGHWPFSINGIIVDGAKIDNVVHFKDLFIYKQRSYNMYDLIDVNGVVYEYVRITYLDQHGDKLAYHTPSDLLAEGIANNHFFIKIQDIKRNIFGFITLIQSNKVKVSTGDYIFIEDDMDLNLLTVKMIPSVIRTTVSKSFTLSAEFMPFDYRNKSGVWSVEDPNLVHENTRTYDNTNTFVGSSVGNTTIFFTPNGNKSLTTSCEIYISEDESEYSSWGTRIRGDVYKVVEGDEFNVVSIFTPFSYIPDDTMKITIVPDKDGKVYAEYIGTTDNINFNFKGLTPSKYTSHQRIIFEYQGVTSDISIFVYPKKLIKYANMDGDRLIKPGETTKWVLNIQPGEYFEGDIIWDAYPASIATIDQTGLVTAHGIGTYTLTTTIPGSTPLYTSGIVANYIEEAVIGPMKNSVLVGDDIQLTCDFLPAGSYNGPYTWNSASPPEDCEAFELSDNKLKILRATNAEPYSQGVQLYIELPDGIYVKENDSQYRNITASNSEATLTGLTLNAYQDNTIFVSVGYTAEVGMVKFVPSNASNKDITVSTENTSVASVLFDEVKQLSAPSDVIYKIVGNSRGITKITFTSVENHNIKITRTVVVY